jgi:hypothetical protein
MLGAPRNPILGVMDECKLYAVLGEARPCPRESCGLWEHGGEVLDGDCAVARLGLDLAGRPDLARWLLGLRRELELARGNGSS